MIGWEAKTSGVSMISRTGQTCYVKNRMLMKENEALSNPEAEEKERTRKYYLMQKKEKVKAKSSLNQKGAGIFSNKLDINHQEDLKKNYLASEFSEMLHGKVTNKKAKKIRETRANLLQRKFRLNIGEYSHKIEPMKKSSEKSDTLFKKTEELYKSKFYHALKGNEFEARARKAATQEDKKLKKSETFQSVPIKTRVNPWIPLSQSGNLFDTVNVPLSGPKGVTFSIPKAETRSVLLRKEGPNDNRFLFNPRQDQPDPYDATHRKTIPAFNFDHYLSRDNKPFKTNITPSTIMLNTNNVTPTASNVGLEFSTMRSRDEVNRPVKPVYRGFLEAEDLTAIKDKLSSQKRILTPNFNLFKSRYRKDQVLPSYMENLNNRLAITGLSYEMIKANGYSGSDFSNYAYSTFSPSSSMLKSKRPTTANIPSEFNSYFPSKSKQF